MKVGIVTVHDSSNFGSFLQAMAMQEIVKLHGDTPYIIRSRSPFSTLCLFLGYNNSKAVRSLKGFVKFFLNILQHPKNLFTKLKKYNLYKKDWKTFENIISVNAVNNKKLDALLLGSDEIWNVNQPSFQNPYMYGIGIKADKKAGYAISVGNATSDKILSFENLTKGIAELDYIICRDGYTNDVLTDCGFNITDRICDPTIQVDIRKYMTKAENVLLPKEDYILVYSYVVDDETKEFIKKFAKENNLKIVAVSLPQSFSDVFLNCSPLEFGAALSKAKYVYTSTFHGTIFSALYHTKFISKASLPKVKDVLKLLEIEERALPENADYDTFSNILKQDYNFDAMEEKILKLRKESFEIYEKYIKR